MIVSARSFYYAYLIDVFPRVHLVNSAPMGKVPHSTTSDLHSRMSLFISHFGSRRLGSYRQIRDIWGSSLNSRDRLSKEAVLERAVRTVRVVYRKSQTTYEYMHPKTSRNFSLTLSACVGISYMSI